MNGGTSRYNMSLTVSTVSSLVGISVQYNNKDDTEDRYVPHLKESL